MMILRIHKKAAVLLLALLASPLVIYTAWALASSVPVPSIPGPPSLGTDTIKLELAGRYSTITLDNLEAGKSGLTYALRVYADPGVDFHIETLPIDGLECESLSVTSTSISNLTMTGVVNDGVSLGYTVTTTPDVVVSSLRGANSASFGGPDGQSADWVSIRAIADTVVKTLVLDQFASFDGACSFEGLTVGTWLMDGGQVGSGTGINDPDLVFGTTVLVGSVVDVSGNTETGVGVR